MNAGNIGDEYRGYLDALKAKEKVVAQTAASPKYRKVKVYCFPGHSSESEWMPNREIVNTIEEAEVVVFGGGTDIDSKIYGEKRGPKTGGPDQARDTREIAGYNKAIELGKKIIGVCRGSQLISALNGANIIQDVRNHGGDHHMMSIEGKVHQVTSSHHQMINPFELPKDNYVLLGWAHGEHSDTFTDGTGKEKWLPKAFVEPETVYYPKTKCLVHQHHPEWMVGKREYTSTINWCVEQLYNFLDDKLDDYLAPIVNKKKKEIA